MTQRHEARQPSNSPYPVLRFNPDEFRSLLREMGLSRTQQNTLLEDVWLIVVSVIDAAFSHRLLSPRHSEKSMAVDSDDVLRSMIISKEQKVKGAQVEEDLDATRKDS